ncbi:sensor histidine kinase [Geothrix sp. 21YS21S-2]|uniref:sensor histidine kinase n=1 Tax=Geothrix sp. 21YS21S-2 TaxID=3068893 RepID=UPI0027BB17AF|nr:ATP-binding protein [Geothrix sp. 21YS21S-2]
MLNDPASSDPGRTPAFEAALRSRKAEALNALASGIVHDLNNLLTAIIGNATLARMAVEPDDRMAGYLRGIDQAAQRTAARIGQLQAFTGKGVFRFTQVDLDQLVRDAVRQAPPLPPQVDLVCEPARDTPRVIGDSALLAQVIAQLLLNAQEAFPDGRKGRITVSTGPGLAEGGEAAEWIVPMAPGPCAFLEVADEGTGMTPEVLARAFDPFFTTKFMDRGLGLPAVMGILRKHGGGLRVETEPGKGTRMKVFLPPA